MTPERVAITLWLALLAAEIWRTHTWMRLPPERLRGARRPRYAWDGMALAHRIGWRGVAAFWVYATLTLSGTLGIAVMVALSACWAIGIANDLLGLRLGRSPLPLPRNAWATGGPDGVRP
jgi:hypothetical protein